jgi:hypothetical protein
VTADIIFLTVAWATNHSIPKVPSAVFFILADTPRRLSSVRTGDRKEIYCPEKTLP